MVKKWYILYTFLFFVVDIANANNGFYTPITSIQGLSQNEVRCILQDKKGYLWVGTQDGLNQYDGYEFKKYSRIPFDKNSLSSELVNTLMEDSKERLWIGTIGGLDILDKARTSFTSLSNHFQVKNSVTNVKSIVQVDDGTFIVATAESLFKLRESNGSFSAAQIELADKGIKILKGVKDNRRNIWYVTNKGLYYLPANSNKCIRKANSSNDVIKDIFCDKANNIWYIAKDILYKYDTTIDKIFSYSLAVKASSIFIDRYNELWIGSVGQGIYNLDLKSKNFDLKQLKEKIIAQGSIADMTINSIYEGNDPDEDVLWCGTGSQGLIQYSRSKNSFENLHDIIKKRSPEASSYFSLYTDQDLLFAGTENGLYTLNLKNYEVGKIMVEKVNDKANQHQEMYKDNKDNIWLGTNDGLYIKRKSQLRYSKFDIPAFGKEAYTVFKIKSDKQGNLWAGTSKGLIKIASEGVKVIDSLIISGIKEKISNIGALDIDLKDNLWIGTTKGLYIYNDKTIEKYNYEANKKNGLIENVVNDIYISKKGQVWIASTKGLSKAMYGKGDKLMFEHFTEENGLFNTYIYGIAEDSTGHLWLSSNKGLFDFDPEKKLFKWYGATDGLNNEEFNSGAFYSDNKGNMYFGGINLLVKFNPQRIVKNKHIPKIYISEVKIDDQPISIKNAKLSVKHTAKVVSIKLSAIDFTNPQKNQYAYRIKGLHNEWLHLGNQRIINLINLPYGDNVIEVKGSNNEGVWNEQNFVQLTINRESPFWRKTWFYALLIAFVSALMYALHKSRLNAKLAMERVRLEENERVRKMASQDLHDDFGNSLTRITILTEMIMSKIHQHKYEEADDLLMKISDNSNRLYQGTKDFIWSISANSENLFEAIVRIKDYAEESLSMTDVSFTVTGIDDTLKKYKLPPASSRHVVMIMKEAIMNTLKHAEATNANMVVLVHQNLLKLQWSDNGKGIPSIFTQAKGNGMDNMKNRSTTIGASIDIQSNALAGTTITIILPIVN